MNKDLSKTILIWTRIKDFLKSFWSLKVQKHIYNNSDILLIYFDKLNKEAAKVYFEQVITKRNCMKKGFMEFVDTYGIQFFLRISMWRIYNY